MDGFALCSHAVQGIVPVTAEFLAVCRTLSGGTANNPMGPGSRTMLPLLQLFGPVLLSAAVHWLAVVRVPGFFAC